MLQTILFTILLTLSFACDENGKIPENIRDSAEYNSYLAAKQNNFAVTDSLVNRMLFPGSRTKVKFDECENQSNYDYDLVETTMGGEKIRFYERNVGSDNAIIFFHGNGATACSTIDLANFLTSFYNESIIVAEYPGYSTDKSKASQKSLTSNAVYLYDYVSVNYNGIDLFGHSLGTSVANYVASKEK